MQELLEKMLNIINEDSDLDSLFKPASKDEVLARLGIKRILGTNNYEYKGMEFSSKSPILSHRYNYNVFSSPIKELPTVAKASREVIRILEQRGVKWIRFLTLKLLFPRQSSSAVIKSGLQSIGIIENLVVIFESKVGVGSGSAGYLGWVGEKELFEGNPDSIVGSTYTSSKAALEVMMRKIDKLLKTENK
jgi:hypothetical protein